MSIPTNPSNPSSPKAKLQALLAARRAASLKATSTVTAVQSTFSQETTELASASNATLAGLQDDPYQTQAVELALSGKSFVVTGPAGSGKSTTFRRILQALQDANRIGVLHPDGHKHLRSGTPSVVITSFTNRAVDNDRRILGSAWASNCHTIHKLLEFTPTEYLTEDGKKSMRFEPKRTKLLPLPPSITHIVIEEATLVNVPLWNMLWEAVMTNRLQVIFVGDIQQLPPVFGKPIFIHAMQQGLPIVELKNVYRQALESPILSLAHRILSGKAIPAKELPEWNRTSPDGSSKLQLRTWPGESVPELRALVMMQKWLPAQIDSGKLDPMRDIILTPVGKAGRFGATELNKIIAGHLAQQNGSEVWEVYTGMEKKYFRVGERVIVDKQEGIITDIQRNVTYYGKTPRPPATNMDYSGVVYTRPGQSDDPADYAESGLYQNDDTDAVLDSIDEMFEGLGAHTSEDSSTSRAASHIITVAFTSEPDAEPRRYSGAGEVQDISLGYVMSVHKSQGSEWARVFLMFHASQNMMMFRELLYTAVTRARRELVIVCESNTFVRGIATQRLPGKTLEQKLEKFDEYVKKNTRNGKGNVDEIPIGLRTLVQRNTLVQDSPAHKPATTSDQ